MSRTIPNYENTMLQPSSREKVQFQETNHHSTREANRQLILNYIRYYEPLPRVEIANKLGISRPTVSSIVDELLKEGWVKEGKEREATKQGGRRAINIHFNAHKAYVLGIDIGRHHATMLLTDLKGTPLKTQKSSFDTNEGGKACLSFLTEELQEFIKDNGIALKNILGIGIGIPGTLDPTSRMLTRAPHMPGWNNIDIPGELAQRFKKTDIYLDNDANMGALGESRYGAGKGIQNQMYIKVGTGIGAGLTLDGELYRGRRKTAGEFGHIIVDPDGPSCEGHRGCLESIASASAIIRDVRNLDPDIVQEDSQSDAIDLIVDRAKSGNETCKAVLANAGKYVGIAIADVVDLLNPELLLLDGGVVHKAKEFFVNPLKENAQASSLPAAWVQTTIIMGELADKAIALGAVARVIDAKFGTLLH